MGTVIALANQKVESARLLPVLIWELAWPMLVKKYY